MHKPTASKVVAAAMKDSGDKKYECIIHFL